MARRIWVKNPRVKGGGYYRTIKGPRVLHVPIQGHRAVAKRYRLDQKSFGSFVRHSPNVRLMGTITSPAMKGTVARYRTLKRTGRDPGLTDAQLKNFESGDPAAYKRYRNMTKRVSKKNSRTAGDKQPRSTKAPKSRKPKKTGKLRDTPIHKQTRKQQRTPQPFNSKRSPSEYGKAAKVSKGAVKRASGKKRTLSEAQKAAKRGRAKARRAKRRK